jgi:hypothetical protein
VRDCDCFLAVPTARIGASTAARCRAWSLVVIVTSADAACAKHRVRAPPSSLVFTALHLLLIDLIIRVSAGTEKKEITTNLWNAQSGAELATQMVSRGAKKRHHVRRLSCCDCLLAPSPSCDSVNASCLCAGCGVSLEN